MEGTLPLGYDLKERKRIVNLEEATLVVRLFDLYLDLALPNGQSHVIDPFVKGSTGGILVQLKLDADHIRPSRIVDGPGLIESVGLTIHHERVVAILRGIDALNVPLNVVPAGRPVRTRDSVEDPAIALAIPGGPVAVSKVALTADHEFLAPENLPEIELRGPEVVFSSGVVVDREVPQKWELELAPNIVSINSTLVQDGPLAYISRLLPLSEGWLWRGVIE
jgi:hypothetical protein